MHDGVEPCVDRIRQAMIRPRLVMLKALHKRTICMPMAGQVNALNVARAAAILLFEAVRQRRK
jgi:tRNA(Leu) C34 or U34 (ribose-2'-O)-methylase TrmL